MKYLIDPDFAQTLFDRVLEASTLQDTSSRFLHYRKVLEELFLELTKPTNRFFSDLFSRTTYVFEEENVDVRIRRAVDFTRKRANSVIHERDNYNISEEDELFCIKNLATAIQYFSRLQIPYAVKNTYEARLAEIRETEPPKNSPPKQEYYDFYAIVEKVEPARDTNHGRKLRCQNDEFGAFTLWLWNNKDEKGFGSDLTPFADLVKGLEYARIYVTKVQAYPNKENEFFATTSSLIVLHPDYLIEAKSLSECIQSNGGNPYSHLLSRFDKGEASPAMLIGTLVGKRLDDMSRANGYAYLNTFTNFMQEQAFGFLVLADNDGVYTNETVHEIYNTAMSHDNNIRQHVESVVGKTIYIEPTFISAQYGLLGRLDALYEDKNNPNHKEVLELKSGSPLANGVWPNHEAQTLAYDLMLRSVYPNRTGTNAILYSKPTDEPPLRHVDPRMFYNKLRLLMTRNVIVANELKLSLGNMDPLERLVRDDVQVPKFSQELLVGFKRTYQQLTPLEKAYFQEFTAFAFRELRIAKMGPEDPLSNSRGFASLWKLSKAQKLSNYDALVNLTIKKVVDNSILELELPKDELFSNSISGMRAGDTIVLYPTPEPENLNPLHSQILKGNIEELQHDRIKVKLIHEQVDGSYFKSSKLWAVERDFSESSYKEWLLSLYRFMETTPDHKKLIFGQIEPKFEQRKFNPIPELNSNQNEIVARALNAKNYFLIQGPPGTGKTSRVLCNIVDQLIKGTENVLVIAFTNRAVDEICEKLTEKLNDESLLIRLGRKSTLPNSWQTLAESLKLNALHERVLKARVVVSTQSSFASSMDLLKLKSFDTLIVDEASQLTELHLVGLLHHFKRFILIGDEKQLPAVVLQSEAKSETKSPLLIEIGLPNLRDSLFTRLLLNAQQKGWHAAHGLRRQHYRMHEDIAHFINHRFYDSQLESGRPGQKAPIEKFREDSSDPIERALARNRMLFIPSPKENRSKVNEYEAQVVKRVLETIKRGYGSAFSLGSKSNALASSTTTTDEGQVKHNTSKIDPTVGVITPFRAQMATIRKHLGPEYNDLMVDTVERYQGSERDVIIISYALSSPVQLQSVSSFGPGEVDRKLNVALSRAKEFVIITGNEDVMHKHQHMGVLLDEIRDKGGYLELE